MVRNVRAHCRDNLVKEPWSCILIRTISGVFSSPGEKDRYHHDTGCFTYRCFLPDLTGFISVCHVRSTSSPKAIKGQSPIKILMKDFQSRISGSRVTGHR